MDGFMGLKEERVISAYLGALSVEARDRIISAPYLALGAEKGPCVVMVAENSRSFLERLSADRVRTVEVA